MDYETVRHNMSKYGGSYDKEELSRYIRYAEGDIDSASKLGVFVTESYWNENHELTKDLEKHFMSKGFKTKIRYSFLINEYKVNIMWHENWKERWVPFLVRYAKSLNVD